MLSSSNDINGCLLSHLKIHNVTSPLSQEEKDIYECEFYEYKKGVHKFVLYHVRGDGHTVLLRKAYSKINSLIKKSNDK